VHVTRDGGKTWTNLTGNIAGLPANTWCSRVLASRWVDGRVYATFDGHRSNDFKPYVYVSEDYGQTWSSLAGSLPEFDSVYVIVEGTQNPDLLFLGSEMSLRVSMDRGQNWTRFRQNFPTVAVHDLAIHPRERDLIVGTHGRAIWTVDINGLESLSATKLNDDLVVARPQDVLLMGRMGGSWFGGDALWVAPNNQPGTRIFYYLKEPVQGDVRVTVSAPGGENSVTINGTNNRGMNVVAWNGRLGNQAAAPGDYRVVVTAGDKTGSNTVKVVDAAPR
jgi:hypothetical protein